MARWYTSGVSIGPYPARNEKLRIGGKTIMPDIRTGLVPLLDDDGRLAANHTPTVVEQRLAALEAAVAELAARVAALESPAG